MAGEQATPEAFNWGKFFSGFTTAVGWAKTTVMIVKIVLILVAIGGPVLICRAWYTTGYKAGQTVGYKGGYKDASDWFAAHPVIQTGDNCTINNNVQEKDNHFKIGIFPLRIGWCS